jgi:hypothetical protein
VVPELIVPLPDVPLPDVPLPIVPGPRRVVPSAPPAPLRVPAVVPRRDEPRVALSRVVDPAPDMVVSVEVDPEAVPDVPVPMVEDPVVEEPVVPEPVPVPASVPPAPLPPVVCASAGLATSARAAIEVYRVFFMITLRLQCSWKRNLSGPY